MAKVLPDALSLYAVIDAATATSRASSSTSLSFVHFRDLAAAVVKAPYARVTPGHEELEDYIHVVDELHTHGPLIPAPPGTVFHDADVLRRWLELHYAKLHEALGEVEQRTSTAPPYDFIQMDLGA